MSHIIQVLLDGDPLIWTIFITGLFGLAICAERGFVLYYKYAMDTEKFLEKVKGYIMADQIEEAVTYSAANARTPLGFVTKAVLERANRDEDAVQNALDISMAQAIPSITRRLGFLPTVANVATLMGLFGTITGLIMSFKAVAFADPSQKQTLLAQGISISMNATAFGLGVAIPIMILYAFLHSKQSEHIEKLSANTAKVLDYMLARTYKSFDSSAVYPSDLEFGKLNTKDNQAPPAPKKKVS
jgi:biopolymer transport protein ExbB